LGASYIGLKDAKKNLKQYNHLVYIFKLPNNNHNGLKFKYPLGEHYNCLKINKYIDHTNDTDFEEYIELKINDDNTIEIMYKENKAIKYTNCIICDCEYDELQSWQCDKCNNSYCRDHNTEEFVCDC
jgi:hypothetical protein